MAMARPPGECEDYAPDRRPSTSIGGATMLSNGTLQLWLRAESSADDLGDAQFLVAPTDDDCAGYLVQLGGLCPGDEVSVPPWPDCDR
jgi:hypothetical protein